MQLWGEFITIGAAFFLFAALALALSFEFVNGFHDTANAVATVIYTNTLKPYIAVIWSGFWNFIGVANFDRSRGLQHRSIVAGRTGHQCWHRRGLRHGVRPAAFRYHLEPWNLVSRSPGFQLAHFDRIDHGGGSRKFDVASRACLRRRRQLGPGEEYRILL